MRKFLSACIGLLAGGSLAMGATPNVTAVMGEISKDLVKTDLEGGKLLAQPGMEISVIKHTANGLVENSCLTVADTPSSIEARNKAKSEVEQVEVTFIVKESETYPDALPRSMSVISLDYPGARWSLQLMGQTTGKLSLPKGNYVVATTFASQARIWLYSDLTVTEETNFEVCADDAIYTVKADFKVPGGEDMIFRTFDPVTGEATDAYYNTIVLIGDYAMSYKGCSAFGTRVIDEGDNVGDVITFNTNVNTADGSAFCTWTSYMPENVKLIDGIVTPLSEATTTGLLNNPDQYVLLDPNMFHSTNDEIYPANLEEFYLYDAEAKTLQGVISGVPTDHKIYIGGGLYGASTDFTTFNILITTYNDWSSLVADGILTPPCAKTADGLTFLATNPWIEADKPFDSSVYFNPAFSYSSSNMTFGGSNAYSIVRLLSAYWYDDPYYYPEMSTWFGNAGENRRVDSRFTELNMTLNGQKVDLSGYNDDILSYMDWQYNNKAETGVITVSWTDENIEFEGEIGTSVNTITYDQTSDDKSLPTLTYLTFRNKDGVPTYVFDNLSDGKLSLSAGSYEYKFEAVDVAPRTTTWTYYDYTPVQVKVEYASHESGNWAELPIEEDAAKYFEPGFGAYYEGSLEGVTGGSEDGLYDLRVSVTNESGAMQVQTLSPAFKVGDMVGVEEVSMNSCSGFKVEGGCVKSIDGGDVSVWTLTGSRVANANLSPGVYVARCGKSSAKITVK